VEWWGALFKVVIVVTEYVPAVLAVLLLLLACFWLLAFGFCLLAIRKKEKDW
jgi:hypothetical protein